MRIISGVLVIIFLTTGCGQKPDPKPAVVHANKPKTAPEKPLPATTPKGPWTSQGDCKVLVCVFQAENQKTFAVKRVFGKDVANDKESLDTALWFFKNYFPKNSPLTEEFGAFSLAHHVFYGASEADLPKLRAWVNQKYSGQNEKFWYKNTTQTFKRLRR